MPEEGKKGITVKVDADLHAEVAKHLKSHGLTMAEFVTAALKDELRPKMDQKEGKDMENMRTLAFQVPEELFLRIKDYLQRNHMKQKEFVIGLIERELDREQARLQTNGGIREDTEVEEMDGTEHAAGDREAQTGTEGVEAVREEERGAGSGEEDAEEAEEEAEEEGMGLSLGM